MPTPSSYGSVINRGVKYIKVNRFDSGGLDRTDYLQQLQSLTLTYPDRNAVNYPIATIQEQANYYLYGIVPSNTNNTSSKGEILDYSFISSKSNTPGTTPSGAEIVTNYTTIVGNTLSYFSTSSGFYVFGNTSNAVIKAEVEISNVADPNTIHYLIKVKGFIVGPIPVSILYLYSLGSVTGNGTISVVLTGSNSLLENTSLSIFAYNNAVSADADVTMSMIQTTTPFNGSSSLTIFNPEFIDFEYNDYNALYGNAEIPQISTVFMDVDYSEGLTAPVNFDLIISGTADKAYVQDSNYASSAWSNLRYKGVKYNSYKIITTTTRL